MLNPSLDDIPLPHAWHGSGPPLVLIAGLGGKGTGWGPFLGAAASRFHVLTFDNPGSGRAPALPGPPSIRAMARCVLRLLDRLGVDGAALVGRSMGGMIAQELALLDARRFRRLVLVSTTARAEGHLSGVFRLWADMATAGVPAELRQRSSLLWCLGTRSLTRPERVGRAQSRRAAADRPRDYAWQARACAGHDALERLSGLDLPTLVVGGSDDRLTPATHTETLAKAIPGAALAWIPEAGHLPYLEEPGRFASLVLDYLSEGEGP